jgi:hypothetical protein
VGRSATANKHYFILGLVAILDASQTYYHRRWFGWFDKLDSVSAETNEKPVLVLNWFKTSFGNK